MGAGIPGYRLATPLFLPRKYVQTPVFSGEFTFGILLAKVSLNIFSDISLT